MLYEQFKDIEKTMEGNEYFEGGVAYYVAFDKLENNIPLDIAIKKRLNELEVDDLLNSDILTTPIRNPQNEIKKLCEEWHISEEISSKILNMICSDIKLYRFCNDNVYVSRGVVCEIFRVIEKGEERILIDFYIVD